MTVVAQYTLEEYDIVSLSATHSEGLEKLLRDNGYEIPKSASAAFKPYINQGVKFFVAKVNLKEQTRLGYGTLRPLQFAFESEKFMLPMRLGMLNAPPNTPQNFIVYLLTKNGCVESSNNGTAKLASNENLPPFLRAQFKYFYKALYDTSTAREDYRAVFTEYFLDMGWCDPCVSDPLSAIELRKAAVFWVGGEDAGNMAPAAAGIPGIVQRRTPMLSSRGGAQAVLLTRLHVQYTANTLPEDLMFTQTKDRQNWQSRYVIQNPYASGVAACSEKTGKADCEAVCSSAVSEVQSAIKNHRSNSYPLPKDYRNKSSAELRNDCAKNCSDSKRTAVVAAAKYFERDLPERLAREKQTLAKLTG